MIVEWPPAEPPQLDSSPRGSETIALRRTILEVVAELWRFAPPEPVFAATVLFLIVTPVVLPLSVLLRTASSPTLAIPPPVCAELPRTVLRRTVSSPSLRIPPPAVVLL